MISSEISNNVGNYFYEFGKKSDIFRIKQREYILHYEVEKAKIADKNEEDLDILNEQLDVIV